MPVNLIGCEDEALWREQREKRAVTDQSVATSVKWLCVHAAGPRSQVAAKHQDLPLAPGHPGPAAAAAQGGALHHCSASGRPHPHHPHPLRQKNHRRGPVQIRWGRERFHIHRGALLWQQPGVCLDPPTLAVAWVGLVWARCKMWVNIPTSEQLSFSQHCSHYSFLIARLHDTPYQRLKCTY